jgi:serine/threonine protein kinase
MNKLNIVPGSTTEFADLLQCLLTKDPGQRMRWADLVGHPFWNAPLDLLEVPPQAAWDDYMATRDLQNQAAAANQQVRATERG